MIQYVSSLHQMSNCKQQPDDGSPTSPATPTMILPPPPPPPLLSSALPPILPHHQHDLCSPSTAASLASLLLHHHPTALTAGCGYPWATFSWMAAAAAAASYAYGGSNPPPPVPMDLSTAFQPRNSLSIADLRLKAKRHAEELDAAVSPVPTATSSRGLADADQP